MSTTSPDPEYSLEDARRDIADLRGTTGDIQNVVSLVNDTAVLLYAPDSHAIPRGPTTFSWEDGTLDNWTASAGGAITNSVVSASGWPTAGTHSLLLTANNVATPTAFSGITTTTFIPSQPGDIVSASIDIYTPATLAGQVFVGIKWRDDTGTLISEPHGTSMPVSAGQVQTLYVTATAPDLTAGFAIVFGSTTNEANGKLIYGDNVQVQGNLVISISPGGGTDAVGNVYPAGIQAVAGNSTIEGTDYIFNNSGLFLYSGVPAVGNLIASVATVAGSDTFGNATLPGWTAYTSVGGVGHAASLQAGGLSLFDNVSWPTGAWPGTSVATLSFNANLDTLITTAGQLLMVDGAGLSQQVSGSHLAQISQANVTTTANSSLGFMTVPANDVITGASYSGHASGSFSTGGTAPSSATFELYWGGTGGTLIGSLAVPVIPINASGQPWYYDFEANWMSGSQVEATLRVGWHNGTGVTNSVQYFTVTNTSGLTTGVDKNLSMAFQWGSAPGSQALLCDVSRIGRVA